MLGAERTTEAQRKLWIDSGRAEDTPVTGRLTASSAVEAVNATERMLCGEGAVPSPAVAEGLAISGQRAATLIDPDHDPVPSEAGFATAVPWVHHRIRPTGRGSAERR